MLLFLLELLFFFLIAACLLRAWMNQLRVQMSVQPGRFAMALTDWLVKPLRRLLPRFMMQSRLDWASLLGAGLLALAYGLAWWGLGELLGTTAGGSAGMVLLMAAKLLIRVLLQGLMLLLLGFVLLSWLQPQSPVFGVLARLCDPIVRPLRRLVPPVGGVDLSVLVLLVLLQVGMMLLA